MDKFIEESGFNFEDIEDGEVIPETDSLREYMPPKGFVNFNKKREEEIRKELDDAEKRALNKPIDTYDDWINRNKQGESGSQLDVLYAEQESILQKINDLESQSIRVGLVGSDDELIEIDDDIEFQKEKLQDVIKQIDSFAGETDWLQFTKDFVNLDNAGLDIQDLLELQKDKDIELAETKEHLTDEDVKDILEEIRAGGIIFNELSPEVQEELIQYSDDTKLYMGGKIDPSIFDDESYSTEGGYGSGKNRHGFGHSKWMREAEVNDSVIKSEDMNKDAVPLEEYTYHSRRESKGHKRNPMERRLEDQIRKREKRLRDVGIDPEEEL